MTARPLTRRAVVAGGLLSTAALSGCSISQLTTRKMVDPEAPDRARLEEAHDLSIRLRADIDASAAEPRLRAELADLHTQQIAQFATSAGLRSPAPARGTVPTATPLTAKALEDGEHALAQHFRALALHADRGDVAALLASAAAGIDQALAR